MTTEHLVEAVKAHALERYEDGGWDVIVECYDDDQIARVIGGAATAEAAIDAFRPAVSVWDERQQDAKNSAF